MDYIFKKSQSDPSFSESVIISTPVKFTDRTLADDYRRYRSSKDLRVKVGSVKAAINSFGCLKGLNCGHITEPLSLYILNETSIIKLIQKLNMNYITFKSIHYFTFLQIASYRRSMSADLYLNFFLPKLCDQLEKQLNPDFKLFPIVSNSFVLPLLHNDKHFDNLCRKQIIQHFVRCYSKYFAIK